MPAWRALMDQHACPIVSITGPDGMGMVMMGSPTVLIDFMMACRLGDIVVEIPGLAMGPMNPIIMGCPTVMIGEAGAPSPPGAVGMGGVAAGLAVSGASQLQANASAYSSPNSQPSAAAMKPVSPEKANALFREMASKADSIPFDYPTDCCYSRAHTMCHDMQSEGVACGKVWNYQNPGPPGGPALRVKTPNSSTGGVAWGYHVAPIVNVQGSDGAVRPMVIDPSMFDHPVSVDEWKAAQNAPNSVTQYTDSAPYYRGIDGANREDDPSYSEAKTQMEVHMNDRDQQDPEFVKQLKERREARVKANSN
jgi:uncharacterized Zn-binding protein involved in type VI secretion